MATVGPDNRPRSRVVHPVWTATEEAITGWVGTRPTPLKVAHLRHSPFVSCAYRSAEHDVAVAECAVEWVDDVGERALAWERFEHAPAPVGYNPATIWSAPDADDFAVLRLVPWRVTVGIGTELATGAQPRVWRARPEDCRR
jgi:hypothetical protein